MFNIIWLTFMTKVTHLVLTCTLLYSFYGCGSYEAMATISNTSITEKQPADSFDLISSATKTLSSAGILRFKDNCFECRVSGLTISQAIASNPVVPVSNATAKNIALLLADRSSYIFGLSKPCAPIRASTAVVLNYSEGLVMLIVYPECKTIRVVTKDGTDMPFLNIDPSYELFMNMLNEETAK